MIPPWILGVPARVILAIFAVGMLLWTLWALGCLVGAAEYRVRQRVRVRIERRKARAREAYWKTRVDHLVEEYEARIAADPDRRPELVAAFDEELLAVRRARQRARYEEEASR